MLLTGASLDRPKFDNEMAVPTKSQRRLKHLNRRKPRISHRTIGADEDHRSGKDGRTSEERHSGGSLTCLSWLRFTIATGRVLIAYRKCG